MHAHTFGHRLRSLDDLAVGAVIAEAHCGVRYRVTAVEQDKVPPRLRELTPQDYYYVAPESIKWCLA